MISSDGRFALRGGRWVQRRPRRTFSPRKPTTERRGKRHKRLRCPLCGCLARSDGLNVVLLAGHRLESLSCWAQGYGQGWHYERDPLSAAELALLLRCTLAAQRHLEDELERVGQMSVVRALRREVLKARDRAVVPALSLARMPALPRVVVHERKPTPILARLGEPMGGEP